MLECPKCKEKNPDDAIFCLKCRTKLEKSSPENVQKSGKIGFISKIPGFRSGDPGKMVLSSAFYILILILVIMGLMFVFINNDVKVNVDSAVYVNAIGNQTTNSNSSNISFTWGNNSTSYVSNSSSEYLLLEVSIKNTGKNKAYINPSDFHLLRDGKEIKSSLFIGNTSTKTIEIPPGETKNMSIAFNVEENTKPTELKYLSFWDYGSPGSKAAINDIANDFPFNGQYATYSLKGKYEWNGGSESFEKIANISYTFLNQPFTESRGYTITTYTPSGESYEFSTIPISSNYTVKETLDVKLISGSSTKFLSDTVYITLNEGISEVLMSPTLQDNQGYFTAAGMLNKRKLNSIGDSMDIVDDSGNEIGEMKVIRSEVIEVLGKKIDCWLIEYKTTIGTTTLTEQRYYDKTSGLLLKVTSKETDTSLISTTSTTEQLLIDTNAPLIGVK